MIEGTGQPVIIDAQGQVVVMGDGQGNWITAGGAQGRITIEMQTNGWLIAIDRDADWGLDAPTEPELPGSDFRARIDDDASSRTVIEDHSGLKQYQLTLVFVDGTSITVSRNSWAGGSAQDRQGRNYTINSQGDEHVISRVGDDWSITIPKDIASQISQLNSSSHPDLKTVESLQKYVANLSPEQRNKLRNKARNLRDRIRVRLGRS